MAKPANFTKAVTFITPSERLFGPTLKIQMAKEWTGYALFSFLRFPEITASVSLARATIRSKDLHR